jgi:hydrogen cyanide synthase HcnB
MNLDPVIVGGGPAGMAAAIELAANGVRCTLLEEAPRLGGVVYRGPLRDGVSLDYLGARYSQALAKLHGEFQRNAGLIDVRLGSRVIGAEGFRALMLLDGDERLREVAYSQLILAAGCHERSVPFPGWTLPGVMMLGGLQLQIKSGVVKPPSPVVIAGTGPLLPLVACQLHASGVTVAGVYEACAFGRIAKESLALLNKPQLFLDGLGMLAYLKRHRIPLRYGWGVVRAEGEGELSSVTVAPYSADWKPDLGQAEQLPAETLAVGYGFIPRTQLSQQMGLDHGFSEDGYLRAMSDAWQRSSEAHIHLAGDMGGIRGGEAAMLSGRIAALSVLLQRNVLDEATALGRRKRYQTQLDRIIRFRAAVDRYTRRGAGQTALPAADTVICRCEHATRADIDRALEQGVQDMASLKMRTRVSMGDCQGRLCVGYCSDRLREATGRTDVGWLRPRFPIDPIPFSAFRNDDSEAVSHDQAL